MATGVFGRALDIAGRGGRALLLLQALALGACEGPGASIGAVCPDPQDANADQRPLASGRGPSDAPSADLLGAFDIAMLCPLDDCGSGVVIVEATAHAEGGLLVLAAVVDEDGFPIEEGGGTVYLQRIHSDGRAELLGTHLSEPGAQLEQLAADGRILSDERSGQVRVLSPAFEELLVVAPPGAGVEQTTLTNASGDIWMEYLDAPSDLSSCSDAADLSGCFNPFFSSVNDAMTDGSDASPAPLLPTTHVVRFAPDGTPRWDAALPTIEEEISDVGEGPIWFHRSRHLDGRGRFYTVQQFLQPERTRVTVLDPEGEVAVARTYDGLAQLVVDDDGATLLFAAVPNVRLEVEEPESDIVGRPLDGPPDPSTFEQALNPTPVEAISPNGIAADGRAVSLMEAGPYGGCPSVTRLDDSLEPTWSWPGLFHDVAAFGDTLVVQELDAASTLIHGDGSEYHPAYTAALELKATHLLDSDGRWLATFDLPRSVSQDLIVGADGVVYLVDQEGTIEIYGLQTDRLN